jgi:cyclomaltodextrinase / maltogenic alpha-amylase / neopullulanase
VRDLPDVNPEFGTPDDFQTLVREIQDRGMCVIIGWVANHTACDNRLTTEPPEWYHMDAEGRFIVPPAGG